uniref:Uncharacterized protein n=1 Tax=Dactylella sp. TaxID=1814903 RepID=A0A482DTI0_9PEZI|nr:hypothetical protein [Dactylella sp.]
MRNKLSKKEMVHVAYLHLIKIHHDVILREKIIKNRLSAEEIITLIKDYYKIQRLGKVNITKQSISNLKHRLPISELEKNKHTESFVKFLKQNLKDFNVDLFFTPYKIIPNLSLIVYNNNLSLVVIPNKNILIQFYSKKDSSLLFKNLNLISSLSLTIFYIVVYLINEDENLCDCISGMNEEILETEIDFYPEDYIELPFERKKSPLYNNISDKIGVTIDKPEFKSFDKVKDKSINITEKLETKEPTGLGISLDDHNESDSDDSSSSSESDNSNNQNNSNEWNSTRNTYDLETGDISPRTFKSFMEFFAEDARRRNNMLNSPLVSRNINRVWNENISPTRNNNNINDDDVD